MSRKEHVLTEREQELVRVSARLRIAEDSLASRDSELSSARKQCETLTFQAQGLESDGGEMRRERDELDKYVSVFVFLKMNIEYSTQSLSVLFFLVL